MTERETNGTTNGSGVRISNREIYDMLLGVKDDVRDLKNDMKEFRDLKSRVRGLELKFYGVLAGLVGALALVLRTGNVI